MQKKVLKLLVVLSLIFTVPVSAACSYKEQADLNREVSNIKATYEVITKTMKGWNTGSGEDESTQYEIFRVNILNLSDNFYIKYSNNINKEAKTVYSSNAVNGIISFEWENINKVATLTFDVYSSNKTSCKDELQRTFYLTLPRYNQYSAYAICLGKTDYSICDKYVTFDEIGYDEFISRMAAKNTNTPGENENTNTNTNTNVGGNYTIYYVVGVAAVLLVITIVIIVNKKRNKL